MTLLSYPWRVRLYDYDSPVITLHLRTRSAAKWVQELWDDRTATSTLQELVCPWQVDELTTIGLEFYQNASLVARIRAANRVQASFLRRYWEAQGFGNPSIRYWLRVEERLPRWLSAERRMLAWSESRGIPF